jgi:hypothetical protein
MHACNAMSKQERTTHQDLRIERGRMRIRRSHLTHHIAMTPNARWRLVIVMHRISPSRSKLTKRSAVGRLGANWGTSWEEEREEKMEERERGRTTGTCRAGQGCTPLTAMRLPAETVH